FPEKTSCVVQFVHQAFVRRNDDRFVVNFPPCEGRVFLPQNGLHFVHARRTSQNVLSLRNSRLYPGISSDARLRIARSRRFASASEEKNNTFGSAARSSSIGRSGVTRFSGD